MVETSSPLRVVLVEANKNDRLLFREAFQNSDVSFDIAECERAEEALELLGADASPFDVVAVDYNLPGISGMDLCRKLLDSKTPLPLVLLTEMGSERLAVEALRAGVEDYIIKDPQRGYLELLPMSLRKVVRRHEDYCSHERTRQVLRKSERAAGAFLDAIPDTTLLIDTEGNILVMNKAGADRMGRKVDEIIGRNFRELFPDDIYKLRQSKVREVIRTGNVVSYEDERDGIYFDTCMCPVFDAQGKVERLAIFARDITDRKKSCYRDEIILKTCIDGFWVIDAHGRILEANDTYCRMSGYSRDELLTMSVQDLEATEAPHETLQHICEIMKKGSHRFESSQKRKDGTIMDLDISATYLELDGGRVFTFFRDITAARQTEEEIRKFKTIADKAGQGVAISDLQGNLIYVNDSFAQMHQYSKRELVGKNLSIFHNEEQCEHVNQLNDQLKQQGRYVTEEVWHKKRDDTVFPTLMNATLIKDEDGDPLFLACTAIDITKHKKAEEALLESELRYRTLFETLPVGIGLSTPEGRIIDANSKFQQMLGYSIEQMRRINVTVTYYKAAERAPLLEQLRQDGSVRGFEVQMKRKDGTIFLASLNVTTTSMRGETVLVTAARDITEHRRIERALAESEEKYRTLVECARDPIFTIDERCVLSFANKVAAETLGYQPEDLVGKTLWDLFPKEIADSQAASVLKVIDTAQGINIVSLNELQGQPRWYSTTIEPLRDDHGRATAAMVIARDVDDMKRAEEQIKKLSLALESSINGIAISNTEENLTYINHAFLEMWGYDHESEVLGRNAAEFWEVGDKAAEITEAMRSEEGWIGELTAVRKDGSKLDIQVCRTSIKDENGRIVSLMGSFVDISESKQREEELLKYRGQMARAEQLASLGTLSATVAHQLTQPLTVIRLSMDNALDELQATSSSETVIRRLKDSVTQLSNITSIVERFRNFARKSSGLTVAEVDLKAVAVRIARLLSESARSAGIVLRLKNMGGLPYPWMNETDLEQLFFALIENAIQAANGKKGRQLVISGSEKDENIDLRFSDNCGGIATDDIDKIFEPFFTTKPRGQGTGLGLCIVQDVVSRIGGNVRVENKFGKGTTFIVSLPVNQGKIS